MTQPSHDTQQEPAVFPLDDTVIELIQQADQQMQQMARDLNNTINGALQYFIRTHKLQGAWRLAANRREIELAPQQPAPGNGNQ